MAFPVVFLFPATESLPAANAMIVFTGRTGESVSITGCGTGTHPVQYVVVIVPGEGATQPVPVIVTSQTDPVKAGTRLENVQPTAVCSIAGTDYKKMFGTVART